MRKMVSWLRYCPSEVNTADLVFNSDGQYCSFFSTVANVLHVELSCLYMLRPFDVRPAFTKAIHRWLSSLMIVATLWSSPKSRSSCWNQIASWHVLLRGIYPASIEDNETQVCFWLLQEISPSPYRKTYPLVDLRVVESPARPCQRNPACVDYFRENLNTHHRLYVDTSKLVLLQTNRLVLGSLLSVRGLTY